MENQIVVQVDFYATIQPIFGTRSRRFDLYPATTVRQLLTRLCTTDRQRKSIFKSPETLRKDVTIFRNGRNIVFLNGLDTQLHGEDRIAIFPPVAGG